MSYELIEIDKKKGSHAWVNRSIVNLIKGINRDLPCLEFVDTMTKNPAVMLHLWVLLLNQLQAIEDALIKMG